MDLIEQCRKDLQKKLDEDLLKVIEMTSQKPVHIEQVEGNRKVVIDSILSPDQTMWHWRVYVCAAGGTRRGAYINHTFESRQEGFAAFFKMVRHGVWTSPRFFDEELP